MKTLWPLLLLTLLLQAHTPAARAQTPAGASAEAAEAELERKALGLVGEALADASSLKLPENRIRAQATAARLLWPRDPKAARAAFKAAADGFVEMNAAVDTEDPQLYNVAQTVAQLRSELITLAAPFDAGLALDFLRATRPTYADALATAGYGQPVQEQALEMSIVAYIAAQDPQRALEIAEEGLTKGVTISLLGVVQQLRTKDPASASKLAVEIARRLRPEDLWGQNESAAVAQQLIVLTRPVENPAANPSAPSTGPVDVSYGRGVPDGGGTALLDEQTRRELCEKVLAAVAAGVPNQGNGYNLFYALQALLPELEKTAPARVAALRRKADEMERAFNPYQRQMRPYQQIMQTGTVEAVLEAARKAPAEVRDQLYTHAAWKVFNDNGGDPERAWQILESLSNPQQRAQVRREMEQRAQWRAVQQGSYAEARQALARLRTPEERVQGLLQIAGRAAAAGNVEQARQTLEEARGLVESQTRGQPQFSYRLQVANVYAQFDKDAAFELVESAVGRLDVLMDAAEVVDGFGQDAFREGELRAQQGGYIWNEMLSQCAQALALLARADFERAAAAAKKFRRTEARTTAQLLLAQNLLGGLPTKPEFRGRVGGVNVITKEEF
ncbi:MAG: hypothetical protein ACJ754_28050 [Pyrinomonadaceae bacterium]